MVWNAAYEFDAIISPRLEKLKLISYIHFCCWKAVRLTMTSVSPNHSNGPFTGYSAEFELWLFRTAELEAANEPCTFLSEEWAVKSYKAL